MLQEDNKRGRKLPKGKVIFIKSKINVFASHYAANVYIIMQRTLNRFLNIKKRTAHITRLEANVAYL